MSNYDFAKLFRSMDQAFIDAGRVASEEARARATAAGLSVTYEEDGHLILVRPDGTAERVKPLEPYRVGTAGEKDRR